MPVSTLHLGVNIDHVATLRQARYSPDPYAFNAEPDLEKAATACEDAGAHSLTVHLRADRRHLQDADLPRLRALMRTKLNLELGNTPDIVAIALRERPADVCLVPENRREVTTEGGLDVVAHRETLAPSIQAFAKGGIRVSLFIDPDAPQIEASAELGAPVVELHTGAYANSGNQSDHLRELDRLRAAAELAHARGLVVNAGHGLNYANLPAFLESVPHLHELNIGHSIVSRALFVGLDAAVREMLGLMKAYRL
jgi:pyridoxine 5-phosphate synthase